MMIKDHYGFYRDNFINDQVGLEPMFPEPSALCRVVVRAWQESGNSNDSSQIGPDTTEWETDDHKEV
jgi:hypothetical protein